MIEGDGETYETGLRIPGEHCLGCGGPSDARNQYDRTERGLMYISREATTLCCGRTVCYGCVDVNPWIAKAHPDRTVWACHLALAERHLGEPAWLKSVAS